MRKLQIQNITIEYDEKTKKEALKLKKQIEESPLIFNMILNGYKGISFCDKEGYFNVAREGNIEATLTSQILFVLEREYQKDSAHNSDTDIELAILKYALIEYTDSFELYPIEKLPDNMIHYYMAYLKYKKDHNEEQLISFVLSPQKEAKENLFNELHRKHGIALYNFILQEQLQFLLGQKYELPALDVFLVHNINEITALIQDVFTRKLIESGQTKDTKVSLENITFAQYDRLCKEYLIKIDPSLKWLKIYLASQENGNIKYLKDGVGKWESLNKDGINIINAPLTGTIEDVVSTIHEFSHYIVLENLQEGESIPRTLAEFPSLFFEENIYAFLLEKGYSKEQILTLKNQRKNWTEENSMAVLPYLNYLKEYILEGPLTEEKLKQYLSRVCFYIENSYETIQQLPSFSESASLLLESDMQALIDNECLVRNTFLIRKNDVLLEYPYVIGSYLAEVANELSTTDDMVIPDILNYTEQLGSISPRIIFDRFNISLLNRAEQIQKQYTKNKKD